MKPAFWDASALVPLCVQQQLSPNFRKLPKQYEVAVWWATSVEMRSAFERLLRMGQINSAEYATARLRQEELRQRWRVIQPTEIVRKQAEDFLMRFPLKAADGLQLSAAWMWCSGDIQNRRFLSADTQLLNAARQLGLQIVLP